MQVSSGRLVAIKAVLWIGLVLAAAWGIGGLLFPQAVHNATAPASEPFNSSHNVATMTVGALALAWAFAIAMAVRWPLQNAGLLLAIIAAMLTIGLAGFYINAVVSERSSALTWGTDGLLTALGVALLLLIPRGSKA
jgi:hypothetical protein